MPEEPISECLKKRNAIIREIIQELTAMSTTQRTPTKTSEASENVGKLLSDIWDILKERNNTICDNCYNLSSSEPEEEQRNITIDSNKSTTTIPEQSNAVLVCHTSTEKITCEACKPKSKTPSREMAKSASQRSAISCIKEAVRKDKQCDMKTKQLRKIQQKLQSEIIELESREKAAMERLKEADSCWAEMEDQYRKKVAAVQERQKTTLTPKLETAEREWKSWRQKKTDLELKVRAVTKYKEDIKDQMRYKINDIKRMDTEIADYKTKLNKTKKDLEIAKKKMQEYKKSAGMTYSAPIQTLCQCLSNLKKGNQETIKKSPIEEEIERVTKSIEEEQNKKRSKETQGAILVREVRRDVQNLTGAVIKLKLERERLCTEKNILIQEKEILQEKYNNCNVICARKTDPIEEEIKNLRTQIAERTLKCKQCHQNTDTVDKMKCCTDCPRCQTTNISNNLELCGCNHSLDCVCMSVKRKFLDNVFDNMYTVLERKANSNAGKSVASQVLTCLEKSVNGKLDLCTRAVVQDFIMTIMKKNLNLSIVGGAVKTRCEMDAETYKQLMLCLRDVPEPPPVCKIDKCIPTMLEPCERWGGTKECNCPKGPKNCRCTKKPRPPTHDCCSSDDPENNLKTEEKPGILCKTEDAFCAVAVGNAAYCHVTIETPNPVKDSVSKDILPEKDDTVSCSRCSQSYSDPSRANKKRQKIVQEVLGDFTVGTPTTEDSTEVSKCCDANILKASETRTLNIEEPTECDCPPPENNILTSSYYAQTFDEMNRCLCTCTTIDMAENFYPSRKKTRGKKRLIKHCR